MSVPPATSQPQSEGLSPGVSVLIPLYYSAESLPLLLKEVSKLAPQMVRDRGGFEVLLVNDGSNDDTWRVVQQQVKGYPWIRAFDLNRNYGQHNALLVAIRKARYDTCVTIDDDLQHPTHKIPCLLEKLDEGYDVVYGTPEALSHHPLRNFLSSATKRALSWSTGIPAIAEVNAFRAFRTRLREGFSKYQSPHTLIDVLLSWATSSFTAIQVPHKERLYGKSGYNPLKLLNQLMILLTGYTTAPLRASSMLGLATVFASIGMLVYVLLISIVRGSIPGFPFLACLTILFGGANLFCLGVLGEYLARMFERGMNRPPYFVREVLESAEELPVHEEN